MKDKYLPTDGYKKPFFSIVTCTRNSEKYIKQNIESVKSQVCKDFEHIIIDGKSEDKTLEIIKKYKRSYPQLILHSHPPHGISDALNKGICHSNGEFIIHLNSDDLFHNKFVLNSVKELLEKNLNTDVLYGKILTIESTGIAIGEFPKYKFMQTANSYLLRYFNFIPHQATFVRKSVFKKHGMFDTKLRANMDYDFWLRIITHTKWCFIDTIVSNYRVHKEAQSTSVRNRNINYADLSTVLSRYLLPIEVSVVVYINRILNVIYKSDR